jgi:alpha-L-fucosidase
MQQLLSTYAEQRFGMFIHYNMNTYYAGWGENRVAPTTFAPPNVDCHSFTDQWAAAAKSAGMKFGLLTTKHHDGFAIWPSKATPPSSSPYGTTPYTIAQSAVPTMDVVKCYVDSFRAQGLDPDLYFSIWDPNNGIGSQAGHNTAPGPVDWNVVGPYITAQITELLTNYGNIPLFVFDGYAWLTGHQQVPYQQIHALIRKLQPNTIIMDHNGGVPWEVDTEYFEEPLGVRVPTGNVTVGSQGQTIAKNGNWFWDSGQATSGYLTAANIASELRATEPNYTNFILDCPPNPQGMLDAPVVAVLAQIPTQWTPNASRAPLPAQLPKIEVPLTPVSATATSGNAALAIDGYNDWASGVNDTLHGTGHGESLWTSTGALPQSLTISLGKVTAGIDMLMYLPQRHTGTTTGNITSYKVLVSADNVTFTQVASGSWPADPTYHGLLSPQRVQFAAQTAQYVRLEADAVAGGGSSAIVGELAVGSSGGTNTGGTGGMGGTGGAAGNATTSGNAGVGGGAGTVGRGGAGGPSGGAGGAAGRGGNTGTGGGGGIAGSTAGSSGRGAAGGNPGVAGNVGTAGAGGAAGGGTTGAPGGGAGGAAGAVATAGTGGGAAAGGGGVAARGGTSGQTSTSPSGGCACATSGASGRPYAALPAIMGSVAFLAARRRRKRVTGVDRHRDRRRRRGEEARSTPVLARTARRLGRAQGDDVAVGGGGPVDGDGHRVASHGGGGIRDDRRRVERRIARRHLLQKDLR